MYCNVCNMYVLKHGISEKCDELVVQTNMAWTEAKLKAKKKITHIHEIACDDRIKNLKFFSLVFFHYRYIYSMNIIDQIYVPMLEFGVFFSIQTCCRDGHDSSILFHLELCNYLRYIPT